MKRLDLQQEALCAINKVCLKSFFSPHFGQCWPKLQSKKIVKKNLDQGAQHIQFKLYSPGSEDCCLLKPL